MQTLTQQFIDNRWVASRGERRLPVVNPTTEAVIAEVTAGHRLLAELPPGATAARLPLLRPCSASCWAVPPSAPCLPARSRPRPSLTKSRNSSPKVNRYESR